MQSFDDDQDSGGSQDGSSDEEQPDRLDQNNDVDEADAPEDGEDEGDGDGDGDGDDDGEDDEDDEGDDDRPTDGADDTTPSKAAASATEKRDRVPTSLGETPHLPPDGQPGRAVTSTAASPKAAAEEGPLTVDRITIREEALNANNYDIVPTIAAPHSTSINVVTSTPDLRWVFSGGSDGYIRKFNWVDTANSKLMLTVAQRHPFVDSVTKAGVLSSYWENDEPQPRDDGTSLSPVYSLAVHNQALWLLSGLESGGINLQSVRHDEGKRIHCLKQHTSAVSVLNLAPDERSVLSGSWDKTVLDWDLNTGQVKRTFADGASQISAIEMRPFSSLPVPETAPAAPVANGTFSSNNDIKPVLAEHLPNGDLSNGIGADGDAAGAPSPMNSLFGGGDDDDLFGENNDIAPPVGLGDDDENEFSRAMARDIQQDPSGEAADVSMADAGVDDAPMVNGMSSGDGNKASGDHLQPKTEIDENAMDVIPNGLPHATDDDEEGKASGAPFAEGASSEQPPTADMTFLAASIDGTIRIWDKRQSKSVAKIVSRSAPPWCMGACWSPDGNFIYAGRRNGTVEEFSLHKGLRAAERTFRFPNGSGAVSAVRAMPNGRHLVCASYDILRLYDLHQPVAKHSSVPFLIVPGHRTGVISQLFVDPSCRFMISTAGSRGWDGNSTQVLLGYEINCE